jgi:hypothetical protein
VTVAVIARSVSDEAIQSFFVRQDGLARFARNDEMPERKMTKAAFDKIKAGLEEAKAYLDELKKRGNETSASQKK